MLGVLNFLLNFPQLSLHANVTVLSDCACVNFSVFLCVYRCRCDAFSGRCLLARWTSWMGMSLSRTIPPILPSPSIPLLLCLLCLFVAILPISISIPNPKPPLRITHDTRSRGSRMGYYPSTGFLKDLKTFGISVTSRIAAPAATQIPSSVIFRATVWKNSCMNGI